MPDVGVKNSNLSKLHMNDRDLLQLAKGWSKFFYSHYDLVITLKRLEQ